MEACTKVKTIREFESFVKEVANLKEVGYVFRGEAQYTDKVQYKKITPTIFRKYNCNGKCDENGTRVHSESKLIDAVLNKFPFEFKDSKNNMDVLLKMQHYEIPTRLLDITFNPYIALLFALDGTCKKGFNERYVYVINTSDMEEKNVYSTDLVSLAVLSRLTTGDREELDKLIMMYCLAKFLIHKICVASIDDGHVIFPKEEAIYEIVKEDEFTSFQKLCEDNIFQYKDNLSKLNNFKNVQELLYECRKYLSNEIILTSSLKEVILGSWVKNYYKNNPDKKYLALETKIEILEYVLADCAEKMPIMEKILNKIRYYNPGFQKRPDFTLYFKDYLIKSYLSNARISNQEGGFILLSPFAPNSILPERYIECVWKIDVNESEKSCMLKALNRMNINKNFIFPELQNFEHNRYLEKEK